MATLSVTPEPRVTFTTRYQDEHLLVVSKRAGLVTQPGIGHDTDTLLNGLFARFGARLQALGRARDFGLLHRLDRDTSGLLIVGLSARAYDRLRDDFASRRIAKFYWAIAARAPRAPAGLIDKPIAETTPRPGAHGQIVEPKLAKVSSAGKGSATAYRTLEASPMAALIEARPLTGRLHQVRVHMELIGCPILGDRHYAPPAIARAAPRLALHAHRIAFVHPITGLPVDTSSPFPRDLRSTLTRMGLHTPTAAQSGPASAGRGMADAPDDAEAGAQGDE